MTKQCFPCTACCQGWLKADINGFKIKPGTGCTHATENGCGIYATRPENPCVSFKCGWLQEEHKLPDHLKPSECGVIVLMDRKWHNKPVIWAVPTGKTIPAETLESLKALARERSIPLLFNEYMFENDVYVGKKKTGYGPPAFILAVETEVGPEDIMMF